ncbi:endonuclease Q family protein, partial [Candidatus Woesearchaeota archaeon]|nr:endonuclease Q family protein [Candidatus Woesearchaeota archaeon]
KELTYKNLINAIRTKKGFVETIEFWPHEGKYHYDGHRACNILFNPEQSKQHNNICPVCKKPLTIGVMNRVIELADREPGEKPDNAVPFKNLIPLSELIAKKLGAAVATKKVWEEYYRILKNFKSEYDVLLNATKEQLEKQTHPKIAEIILLNRETDIKWKPGYDGVYGEPLIETIDGKAKVEEEKPKNEKPVIPQKSLSDF